MFDYKPLLNTMQKHNEKTSDMADVLGISLEKLRDILNNNKYLSMRMLDLLCEHYGCGTEDIMTHIKMASVVKVDWDKVKSFGKSITSLSLECGLSHSALSNAKQGSGKVKRETALLIAKNLNCSLEDII